MIVNAAKMMVVIQNLIVIFDSWNGRCGHFFNMYVLVESS